MPPTTTRSSRFERLEEGSPPKKKRSRDGHYFGTSIACRIWVPGAHRHPWLEALGQAEVDDLQHVALDRALVPRLRSVPVKGTGFVSGDPPRHEVLSGVLLKPPHPERCTLKNKTNVKSRVSKFKSPNRVLVNHFPRANHGKALARNEVPPTWQRR